MAEIKTCPSETLSPEWKTVTTRGISEALQNFELFGPINFAPGSITDGLDERRWHDLASSEREWVVAELFRQVGFNKTNPTKVAEYAFEAPVSEEKPASWKNEATVKVYETQRSDNEGLYLHEIQRPETEIEYMVASKDFQL